MSELSLGAETLADLISTLSGSRQWPSLDALSVVLFLLEGTARFATHQSSSPTEGIPAFKPLPCRYPRHPIPCYPQSEAAWPMEMTVSLPAPTQSGSPWFSLDGIPARPPCRLLLLMGPALLAGCTVPCQSLRSAAINTCL